VTEEIDRPQDAGRFSRRSLIATSAGVATTVAVTTVAPAAALAGPDAPARPIASPSTPVPGDPVVAYVHDAARGEVTVISGEGERTFRDPALVKRLLAAAQSVEVK
jgi:hypothetical protein